MSKQNEAYLDVLICTALVMKIDIPTASYYDCLVNIILCKQNTMIVLRRPLCNLTTLPPRYKKSIIFLL